MNSFTSSKEAAYSRLELDTETATAQEHSPEKGRSRTGLAAYLLLLLGSCLTMFFAGQYSAQQSVDATPPAFIPPIPTTSVTFEPDPRFSNSSSHDSNIAWTTLMPPSEGFVLVQNPEKYNLPPGKKSSKSGSGSLYDISAFHQLHCLIKIREHVSLLNFALENEQHVDAAARVLNPQMGHMDHCFDYLRQGIMCAGDMTLEWPKEGSKGVVDGWGVAHQCRDWGIILKIVERHQA